MNAPHTFRDYLHAQGFHSNTVESYQTYLARFLNWCEDQRIEADGATTPQVMGYVQHLQGQGNQQRTIQLYLTGLKHYYHWLIKLGKRADHPTESIQVRGIKKQRLYPPLNRAELEALYQSWEGEDVTTQRNRAITGVLVYQGVPSSELSSIQTEHLNLRQGTLHIPESRRTNARTLGLEAAQIMDLMTYQLQARPQLLNGQADPGSLFVSSQGNSQLRGLLPYLVAHLCAHQPKLVNLQHLRAAVITLWLGQYNLREVQHRAGHRYVSSTEAYRLGQVDDLKRDIDQYYPLA